LFPLEQDPKGIPATIQPDASLKNTFDIVVASYRPLRHNNADGDTIGNITQVAVVDKTASSTSPGFVTQSHTLISHAPLNVQPTPPINLFADDVQTPVTLARFTDVEGLYDDSDHGFSATIDWGGAALNFTAGDTYFHVQPGHNGADPLVTLKLFPGIISFSKLGTFTVTVKIFYQDPAGGPVVTATSTTTLNVTAIATIQLHGLAAATVGVPIGGTDPIAGTMGDALFAYLEFHDFEKHLSTEFQYEIDWGDGTGFDTSPRLVGIGGNPAYSFIVYATHTYQKAGDFTVTFRVLTGGVTVIATAAYDGPENGETNQKEPVYPPNP